MIETREIDDTALDAVSGGVNVDVTVAGRTLATVNTLDGVATPLGAHNVDVAADGNSAVGVNVSF
jgi:hypothetical protein